MSDPLEIYVGCVFSAVLNVTQEEAGGAPMNLNGYRARLQIRSDDNPMNVLADVGDGHNTRTTSLTIQDAEQGVLLLKLLTPATRFFSIGTASADLLLISASGDVFRPMEMSFVIKKTGTQI